MSQQPTLSLERFATLMAKVAHFGRSDQAEVLERCGVAPALWRESRRHWLEHLTKTDGEDLAEFSRHYARTALGLDLVMPALSDLGPLAREMTINPDDAETLMADSVDPATVMRDVSSIRKQLEARKASDALASLPSSTPSRSKPSSLEPLAELNSTVPSSISPVKSSGAISSTPPVSSTPGERPEDPMAATVFGAPANVKSRQTTSRSPGNEKEAMSPEQYARLAHATHSAPSVMRERVHHELGILSEGHRAEIDRAMTDRFNTDPAAYQVYMQWVSYLRAGGA